MGRGRGRRVDKNTSRRRLISFPWKDGCRFLVRSGRCCLWNLIPHVPRRARIPLRCDKRRGVSGHFVMGLREVHCLRLGVGWRRLPLSVPALLHGRLGQLVLVLQRRRLRRSRFMTLNLVFSGLSVCVPIVIFKRRRRGGMRVLSLGWRGGRPGGRSMFSKAIPLAVLLLLRCLMVAMVDMAIMGRLRIGWRCGLLRFGIRKIRVGERR